METTTTKIPGQHSLKRRVCFTLPVDVADDLDRLSVAYGVNKSAFTTEALRALIKRHARRAPGRRGA